MGTGPQPRASSALYKIHYPSIPQFQQFVELKDYRAPTKKEYVRNVGGVLHAAYTGADAVGGPASKRRPGSAAPPGEVVCADGSRDANNLARRRSGTWSPFG
ncbi:MAG TPA: hypothetical protein VK639_18630, partial [Terriglobales bacterium]|nr:hypothetical protein [Terriglobales bacterium]